MVTGMREIEKLRPHVQDVQIPLDVFEWVFPQTQDVYIPYLGDVKAFFPHIQDLQILVVEVFAFK